MRKPILIAVAVLLTLSAKPTAARQSQETLALHGIATDAAFTNVVHDSGESTKYTCSYVSFAALQSSTRSIAPRRDNYRSERSSRLPPRSVSHPSGYARLQGS